MSKWPYVHKHDEILRTILQSVTELKADMSASNSRIDAMEYRDTESASKGPHSQADHSRFPDNVLYRQLISKLA